MRYIAFFQFCSCAQDCGKQKLQTLVFPEGIRYDKQNNTVQTPRLNTIFALIEPQAMDTGEKKKGNLIKSCLQSYSVNLPSQSSNFLIEDFERIIDY